MDQLIGYPPKNNPESNCSEDVLVRISAFKQLYTAYYNYYLKKWAFYTIPCQYPVVLEWYPIPAVGTGVAIPE